MHSHSFVVRDAQVTTRPPPREISVPTSRFAEFNLDPALAEAAESASDQELIEGVVRLDDPTQVPTQFRVVSQFTRICTGRFLAQDTWAIRRHPNVVSLKAARPLGVFENDRSTEFPSFNCATCRTGQPLFFTGRGCIVAALDFGLDFAHPNFLNPDGTTRVVSFWHQGATYDPTKPNEYRYGRVFSPDDINQALQTPNPYEALGYHPAISDTGNGSHGTHTLDIAAGNGRAMGSRSGIAPKADLMFVHLSTPRLGVVGDLGDSVRMLEALDFVHRTAGDRPYVVNISVGREAGSHDATSPFEQAMHELLRMEPGTNRAICQSAGNYGSADLAVNGWLRDGEERDLDWIVHPTDISPEIDAWYSGNDRFVVVLLLPDGGDTVTVQLGEVADIRHNGNLVGRIYHRRNDPNNRDNHIEVFLYRGAPAGVWTLRLIGDYVITGRFHAWIERAIPGAQSHFDNKITSRRYTLGTIATSPLVVTVGAYDANADGQPLAHFSSCGPTRDERQDKPELLAPGVSVVAARSIPRDALRQEGLLMARSGTSMATPHVTGLIATMFEAAGRRVSIGEIRDCLKQSSEPVTNAENSNCCAWGRLNFAGAIEKILELTSAGARPAEPAVSSIWSMIPESAASPEHGAHGERTLQQMIPAEQQRIDAFDDAQVELPPDQGALMDSDCTGRFLERAERASQSSYGGRRHSETLFLQQLIRDLGGDVFASELSPASIFRAAVKDSLQTQNSQDLLKIVAMPLRQPGTPLRAGDWMLRVVPGTGDTGHVAVLASNDLVEFPALASNGVAAEEARPGYYGVVIEAGAFPHSSKEPFARRFLDRHGRVPPNTLILRPNYPPGQIQDFPVDDDPPHMGSIEPYRRAVAAQERKYRLAMATGEADVFELALLRVTWQIMLDEITNAPGSVLVWDRMGPEPKFGLTGADRWAAVSLQKASEQVSPQYGSPDQLAHKYEEYLNLTLEMLRWGQVKQELIVDKQAGKQYLILGANPLVGKVLRLLGKELLEWFKAQPNTKFLIESSARVGLGAMLSQRPDLATLLRTAQTLPPDVEVSAAPVDRPAMIEALEFAIGMVPVVGNVVAAYEAWSGVDLFGYRLSDLERGILGASVLLPIAGRLVKGGRILYTEARLVSLYGRDAATWSKALGASTRATAEREALGVIEKAERTLRFEKSVTGAIAHDAAVAVPRLTKGVGAAITPIDQAIADVLQELQAAHPQLRGLDALSLERVLAKGPNMDHLKGQLLEELVESRIVPWLSTREGSFALGITVPTGKKLEFIPGHLIRDTAGRQISDGMLVIRQGDELVVAAVFEAKAGKSAARELSFNRASISTLTDAERTELRANAKDVWKEQLAEAKAAGLRYTKTIEDVEKEFALSELGGQVRRDIERLAEGTTGSARIRVGTQQFTVRMSPTKTKFFGVLPRDVPSSLIEQQLKESRFAFEILGVDIKADALKKIAASLQPLAEKLAKAAP